MITIPNGPIVAVRESMNAPPAAEDTRGNGRDVGGRRAAPAEVPSNGFSEVVAKDRGGQEPKSNRVKAPQASDGNLDVPRASEDIIRVRPMSTARRLVVPLCLLSAVATSGCGQGADDDGAASATDGQITVFADDSLADVFTDIALAFESEYEDVIPKVTFDASNALADEVIAGTPADVAAFADAADIDQLKNADLDGSEPVTFATNVMTIVVPVGNPEGVSGVDDLGNPDLRVAVCVDAAPCGDSAQRVFEAAGVTVAPASEAPNTAAVVQLVEDGSADAGIVYATDVTASGDVDSVEIRDELNVVVEYSIVTVSTSTNADVARDFVEFVVGPDGQELLTQYNFGSP